MDWEFDVKNLRFGTCLILQGMLVLIGIQLWWWLFLIFPGNIGKGLSGNSGGLCLTWRKQFENVFLPSWFLFSCLRDSLFLFAKAGVVVPTYRAVDGSDCPIRLIQWRVDGDFGVAFVSRGWEKKGMMHTYGFRSCAVSCLFFLVWGFSAWKWKLSVVVRYLLM